jgi:hypothetical protein
LFMKKLLSEDMLVPFFIHGCFLWQNCEWAHSLCWEATPHMNGACWTFLGALKPSSQQLNHKPWSSWW